MQYKDLKVSIKSGMGDPCVVTFQLLQYGSRALKPLISGLASPSIEMRSYSVECLGLLGDIRAVKPLIEMFKDPENESFFFELGNTIGELCKWENMNIIYIALRSKEKKIRQQIALLLDDYGDEKIFNVLINALKDPDKDVFINICKAINAWSVYLKDRNIASASLSYYLSDENPDKRKAAAVSLYNAGNLRASKYLIKALNRFPADEEFTEKAVISLAGILRNYEHDFKAQKLREFILNSDYTWKKKLQNVLIAENENQGSGDLSDIFDCKTDQSEAPAAEAITSKGSLQDLSEITQISEMEVTSKSSEPDGEQICEKSTRELCSLLYINNREVQLSAIRCLWERADKNTIESYKILLQSKKCLIRLEIAHAIGKLKNNDAVPLLAAVYETAWLELRAQIVRSFGDIGGKSVIHHLIAALHDKHPKIRYIAVGKLKDTMHPQALKAIKMALSREKNKYVKEAMERVIVIFNQ